MNMRVVKVRWGVSPTFRVCGNLIFLWFEFVKCERIKFANKIENKFFNSSLDFFEKYHSPVEKGYLYFNWGYTASFSTGNLKVANVKIVKSLETLATVEECFWRSLSFVAVIHIDHFGAGNGEAAAAASQLVAIWHRFQFEPGFAGCVLKEYLFKGKQLEFEVWMARCLSCVESMKKKGSLTHDTCFSNLAPGEIYLLQGDNKKALPLLKNAYSIHLRYTHRVAYASYSSALLATAYIRLHKPLKAIIPIFFAWVNVFWMSKSLSLRRGMSLASFFACIKCNFLSEFCFKRGISFAEKNCRFPIVAEGQLAFGKFFRDAIQFMRKDWYKEQRHIFLKKEMYF